MDRSRVIVVNSPRTAPQPATGAPKEADDMPERAQDAFMKEFYRQRAGVRKLQHDGKCNGESRPKCYDTCEFSAYCSEWRHTVRTLF